MKQFFLILVSLISFRANAQTTGTNTMIHQREEQQRQQESSRREDALRNEALKPNSPSQPTQFDAKKLGIDESLVFEITNHLFGYSAIIHPDQTLQGIKLTGFLNLAYYKLEEKNSNGRSQSRLVVGLENPVWEINDRSDIFLGGGITMMDLMSFYLDLGYEYHIATWFKVQAGVNWTGGDGVNPQVSLGFVW